MGNGLLTDKGKRRIALLMTQNITHAAIGRGSWADKFNPPDEVFGADGLTSEIGRVPVDTVRYLIQDAAGTIYYMTGTDGNGDPIMDGPYRYATDEEVADAAALEPPLAPSSDIEVQFTVPANVAVSEAWCETAVFMNCQTTSAGWAAPGDVTVPGAVVYLVNHGPKTIDPNDTYTRRVRVRA